MGFSCSDHMGRYAAPRGELPRRRGHEEAMRAKIPGKILTSHVTLSNKVMVWVRDKVRGCEIRKSECCQSEDVHFKWFWFWRGPPQSFSISSSLHSDLVSTHMRQTDSWLPSQWLRRELLHHSEKQPGGLPCSGLFGSSTTGNRCTQQNSQCRTFLIQGPDIFHFPGQWCWLQWWKKVFLEADQYWLDTN